MHLGKVAAGYLTIAVVGAMLSIALLDYSSHDRQEAREHYIESSQARSRFVAERVEGAIRAIYENIRTLAFLPSVQSISRHGENLSDEARLTFQQVYNNLASNVSVSEVYILPANFDPDHVDPVTGKGEAPILMFDQLIVNARDRFLASLGEESEHDFPSLDDEYEEVEIYEYREMQRQLAWLKERYPNVSSFNGMKVPMLASPELITCDNTQYIHTLNDADRSGVVFVVPFYGDDGMLRGGIAAIILTSALRDLIPEQDFALVNTGYGFATQPRTTESQDVRSEAWVRAGEPDPSLIYSEAIPLASADQKSGWALWVGHPDAQFEQSPEASSARLTMFAGFAMIALLALGAAVVWFLVTRNLKAAAQASALLERRVAERTEEIQYRATHDELTGLANRTHLTARLEDALARRGDGEHLAVLCLDIDHFKHINDTLGHPAGDALLMEFGRRLKDCVADHDEIARFGGDEFVVLQLGTAEPQQAETLARRIINAMQEAFVLGSNTLSIGVSIGISIAPVDGNSAEQLLRNADIALYRAKGEGRGTSRFFEAEMDAMLQRRHKLERELRHAVKNREFVLHYQPLVSADTSKVTGFEALVRWQHPERGLLSPADFIGLAEEIGLIIPLGEWILHQACADAATWPDGLKVAVNLSPAQFKQRTLAHSVVSALDKSGLPPFRLELEITESALLMNTAETLALLHQLRDLGVRIAMDDFGTGYSSLSYLRSFPFDRIKIDQSFVAEMSEREDCRAIVNAVSALGRSLGMTTTAEGIESQDQLDLVREQGCTDLQGYFFSKPRPATDIDNMLREIAGRVLPVIAA